MKYQLGILAAALLTLVSCTDYDRGEFVKIEVRTDNFRKLHIDADVDVCLMQGDYFKVEVEGYEEEIGDLNFKVRFNELCVIETGNAGRSKVIITMPDLRRIEHKGSGKIYAETIFELDHDLDFELLGSGCIDLEIYCDDIEVDIRGSGDIILYGEIDDQDVIIDGSGDYYAFPLYSDDCKIKTFGSGMAEIMVDDNLTVELNGSGDIYFRGYPDLKFKINGSGNLVEDN